MAQGCDTEKYLKHLEYTENYLRRSKIHYERSHVLKYVTASPLLGAGSCLPLPPLEGQAWEAPSGLDRVHTEDLPAVLRRREGPGVHLTGS